MDIDAANDSGNLFDLPEFSAQAELLSLTPVERTVSSEVPEPVAHVRLDMPQPHVDREFDYEIPPSMADVPVGARVNVDVAARKIDGFIVSRGSRTNVEQLRPIRRVISPVPVLTPEIYQLAQQVAKRQAAPVANALRLAVPQRHARAEREFLDIPVPPQKEWPVPEDFSEWEMYDAGEAFLNHLMSGEPVRASVSMLAGHTVVDLLTPAIQAVLAHRRGVIVVVPTPKSAQELAQELSQLLPGEPMAVLTGTDHATRYRQFLAILTGQARVVIGTRSAAWAPVKDLGLTVVVDDHHAALAEPRSPYIHARDLLIERAQLAGAAFLALGWGPSVELAAQQPWLAQITGTAPARRHEVPAIISANHFAFEGSPWARMPDSVFTVVREGLARGPVLFSVPRSGYIPSLSCARCREMARCPECAGFLVIAQPDAPPTCERCTHTASDFRCTHCDGTRLRPVRIGSHRTAQEIGRAFRDTPIHLAGLEADFLDATPKIVVATPGMEPPVLGQYASAVVLDAGYHLRSSSLDAETYFLRTIAHVARVVRPHKQGGRVLIVGAVPDELLSVATNWAMGEWSQVQLTERTELKLPPSHTWVEVSGEWENLRTYLSALRAGAKLVGLTAPNEAAPLDAILSGGVHDVIPGFTVLGPRNLPGDTTAVFLRFSHDDRDDRLELIRSTAQTLSGRSELRVRIVVDPQL